MNFCGVLVPALFLVFLLWFSLPQLVLLALARILRSIFAKGFYVESARKQNKQKKNTIVLCVYVHKEI